MSDSNPNAVQTLEKRRAELSSFLLGESMQKQIALALPKTITPQRLARLALTMVQKTPALLDCTRASFLGSLMECAALGLEPGILGQAWIIPYGKTATLVVGYRGMVTLAWRSSLVRSVAAREVYGSEDFAFVPTSETPLHHLVDLEREHKPDEIVAAWAQIRTTTGGVMADAMSRSAIEAIRARSRAGNSGPWTTDYAEMAKKTVLRRLLKTAPQSAELQRAMQLEDEFEGDGAQSLPTLEAAVVDDVEAAKAEGTSATRAKVAATKKALEGAEPPAWITPAEGGTEYCSECGVSRGELGGHAANCSRGGEK